MQLFTLKLFPAALTVH